MTLKVLGCKRTVDVLENGRDLGFLLCQERKLLLNTCVAVLVLLTLEVYIQGLIFGK